MNSATRVLAAIATGGVMAGGAAALVQVSGPKTANTAAVTTSSESASSQAIRQLADESAQLHAAVAAAQAQLTNLRPDAGAPTSSTDPGALLAQAQSQLAAAQLRLAADEALLAKLQPKSRATAPAPVPALLPAPVRDDPPPPVTTPSATPSTTVEQQRANIAYALQQTSLSPSGTGGVHARLSELLLIEVLRLHLASAPAAEQGWAAALRDPVLAPAPAALHRRPEYKWTVPELAQSSTVSRSLLDARFREVLGRSPIRYLTDWRMHVAQNLLATTDLSILSVARRVGYEAEEAFSRAFKRTRGTSPSSWRAAHSSH